MKKIQRLLIINLILAYQLMAQIVAPNRIDIQLISDEMAMVNSAVIKLIPIGSGTVSPIEAQFAGNGMYYALLPVTQSEFQIISQEIDHASDNRIINVAVQKKLKIRLSYNNYYKKYNVSSDHLIEIFSSRELKLRTRSRIIEQKYHLPYLSNALLYNSDRTELLIADPVARERIFGEIIKEIILQTAALESDFAKPEIKNWIQENYEQLSGAAGAPEWGKHLIGLSEIFGAHTIDFFNGIKEELQLLGLAYETLLAANEGLWEGICLVAAYQSFQISNLELFKMNAAQSSLILDEAFITALDKVEREILEEQEQTISEIANKLIAQNTAAVFLPWLAKLALPKALASVFSPAGAPAYTTALAFYLFFEMSTYLQEKIKENHTMLLLAQIDREILNRYAEYNLDGEMGRDEQFGAMMRMHAGFMYHKLREHYYGDPLIEDVLLKKMSTVSKQRAMEISQAYFLMSQKRVNADSKRTIVLILDSSGSMSDNDPEYIRVKAAKNILQILALSEFDGRIILIDFDHSARQINAGYENIDDIQKMLSQLERIDASGNTDLGKPLVLTAELLQSSLPGDCRVLMLTDGDGRYGNEAEWFAGHQYPIYTISLTGEENAMLMQKIANDTGGKYYKAMTAMDIVAIFNDFHQELLGGNLAVSIAQTIQPREVLEYLFAVDPDIKKIFPALSWPGSYIRMELTDPMGKRYTMDNTANWIRTDTWQGLAIPNPEVGRWSVCLTGEDVHPMGEAFQFTAAIESDNTYSLTSPAAGNYSIKNSMPDHHLIIEEIEVKAVAPSGDTLRIHQGNQASFYWYPRSSAGSYQFFATISGQHSQGTPFRRFLQFSQYIGDIKPPNLSEISYFMGANSPVIPMGRLHGCVRGFNISIESADKREILAEGYIYSVQDSSSILEIQHRLSSKSPDIGDVVIIDPVLWNNNDE
jgi:Mg-chelatase subunit ChlD